MSQADEDAIREAINTWVRASEQGDTPTLLTLLTEDMVFLTPGNEPFGKADFGAQGSATGLKLDAEILEIAVSGDLGYTRVRLGVSVETGPDTPPIRMAGHTMTVFRKTDGRWQLARDASMLAPVE